MQSNPIVVDGVLYATTPTLKVIALDAATGREIWKFDPSGGASPQTRFRHRGVTVHKDRVFVTYRNFLFALDRKTGQPIPTFGAGGKVDLREGFDRPLDRVSISASSPGVVFEDLLIMGSTVPETLPGTPGDIRAFDVNTGKIRWTFHTIPHPGEFGYDTWPKDAYKIAGGANAWAGVTLDPKLGMVFAATGSASFDFYGINRHGDNLFADLRARAQRAHRPPRLALPGHQARRRGTGTSPRAPNLVTVTRDGKPVDAVAQTTKTGYVYVLDRRTGKPLFPDRVPEGAGLARSTARARRRAAVSGEAAAVHAAGPHRRHADHADAGSACGGARALRKFDSTACTRRRRPRARSCSPVSTAAPSGAARRSIRTRACSTSTRTRCRGSCG